MDYKDKIKEILKDNTVPEQLRNKMEEILLAAEEIEEDKRLKEFLCKTFTKQYLCSDKLGKWHGEPVANILTWIEKQGNKPQGKTTRQADIDIPFGANDSELQEASYHIPEGFHVEIQGDMVVIKKGEKKSSWSEEDENNLIDACVAIRKFYHGTNGAQELIDWLKSLRVIPQPKEWSETDEKCIRLCTDIINSALRAGFCVQLDRDRCIDWLQSLKQRVDWKPNNEQINALKGYVGLLNLSDKRRFVLRDLILDLEKLINE